MHSRPKPQPSRDSTPNSPQQGDSFAPAPVGPMMIKCRCIQSPETLELRLSGTLRRRSNVPNGSIAVERYRAENPHVCQQSRPISAIHRNPVPSIVWSMAIGGKLRAVCFESRCLVALSWKGMYLRQARVDRRRYWRTKYICIPVRIGTLPLNWEASY